MSVSQEGIRKALASMCAAVPLIGSMEKEGKLQIGKALLRHCQSDEHVATVIQTFLETVLEWRNPVAELVRIAEATKQPEPAKPVRVIPYDPLGIQGTKVIQ